VISVRPFVHQVDFRIEALEFTSDDVDYEVERRVEMQVEAATGGESPYGPIWEDLYYAKLEHESTGVRACRSGRTSTRA
jgi:hypothetical protein